MACTFSRSRVAGFTILGLLYFCAWPLIAQVSPDRDERNASAPNVQLNATSDPVPLAPASDIPEPKTTDPHYKNEQARKYDVERIGQRDVGKGLNFYSLKREQELGRELAHEIELQSRILDDPTVNGYVNRLVQDLVRHSDAKVPFVIKVLDNDEFNAFALPGGFLFVNTGTILAAESEAELAGVLAHEIAHVAARHGTRNATKADLFTLTSMAMGVVGGPAVAIARQVAGIAVPMTFLKFSRNAEREADVLGLEYQYAAGYDPVALIDLFERVQASEKKKKGFLAKSFETHPMKEERVRRAQSVIETLLPPRAEYVVSTNSFQEMKGRVAELTRRTGSGRGIPGLILRRDRTSNSDPQPEPAR